MPDITSATEQAIADLGAEDLSDLKQALLNLVGVIPEDGPHEEKLANVEYRELLVEKLQARKEECCA